MGRVGRQRERQEYLARVKEEAQAIQPPAPAPQPNPAELQAAREERRAEEREEHRRFLASMNWLLNEPWTLTGREADQQQLAAERDAIFRDGAILIELDCG